MALQSLKPKTGVKQSLPLPKQSIPLPKKTVAVNQSIPKPVPKLPNLFVPLQKSPIELGFSKQLAQGPTQQQKDFFSTINYNKAGFVKSKDFGTTPEQLERSVVSTGKLPSVSLFQVFGIKTPEQFSQPLPKLQEMIARGTPEQKGRAEKEINEYSMNLAMNASPIGGLAGTAKKVGPGIAKGLAANLEKNLGKAAVEGAEKLLPKIEGEVAPVLNAVKQEAEILIPKAPRTVGNLRLDKFDLPEDQLDELATIIDDNKGFLEQRRAPMSVLETEKLARELVPKTKLKKGQALNAEELQSLGDTVANLQTKVSGIADRISKGTNSDQDLLELALAKAETSSALASYSGATAEAGRALAILRNIRKASGSAGIGADADLVRQAIKLSGGRESLEELAAAIANAPDNISKIKIVRDAAKVSTPEKIYEVWLNSILSNPTTHAVNIISNGVRALMNPVIRTGEALLQVPGKNRKIFLGEVPQQVFGLLQGTTEGVRKGLYVLRNGLNMEQVSKLDVGRAPAIKGTAGKIIRTPTNMLSAADEFFKAIVGTGEMRAQAYRVAKKEGLYGEKLYQRIAELIDNPTKEIFDNVDLLKQQSTFQEQLGAAGRAVMRARDTVPGLKYIIPFIKTPTNIAKEAIKTSPIGFVNMLRKASTGAYKNLPPGTATTEAAKAAIGSMLAIPIVMKTLEGNITGTAPKDAAERDAFYRSGKLPNAIKIGNKWISYRRVEPLATVIGLVADMTQIADEKGLDKSAFDIVSLIGRNLNDKTFLSGLNSFIDAITDPEKSAKWALNTATGAQPFSGLSRFAARATDPKVRDPQTLKESFMAQIPGLSKKVPAKRNAFGEQIIQPLSQKISPVPMSDEKHDIVDAELSRLNYNLGFPAKSIQGLELSREDYIRYQAVVGQVTKQALVKIMSVDDWDKIGDYQKEQVIDEVVSRVRAEAKEKMFPKYTQLNDLRQELNKRGITEENVQEEMIQKFLAQPIQ